jgi:hypothetical protein
MWVIEYPYTPAWGAAVKHFESFSSRFAGVTQDRTNRRVQASMSRTTPRKPLCGFDSL